MRRSQPSVPLGQRSVGYLAKKATVSVSVLVTGPPPRKTERKKCCYFIRS